MLRLAAIGRHLSRGAASTSSPTPTPVAAPPFSKVLIANRGEIAIRISRAASELGIKSAAIFSGGDERALHVSMADESVALPEGASYLDGGAVVAIAQHVGADCIHTGYGFLSENANFAALCEQQGLKFIGPSSGIYT